MTPETIAAIEVMVESARVQADLDARSHAKGWVHQYAQDVGDLLAEVARARAMLAEVQWASSSYPEDALCPVCSAEGDIEQVGDRWERVGSHHDDCALAALL